MIFIRRLKTISHFKKIHTKFSNTIFSGIQPTGIPHLGNYFGAVKRWTHLQNEKKTCIFSIVDLHSITLPQDPEQLRKNIHLMTACLLACGINPEQSILFLQSQVPQHTELCWILGCLATTARLARLPQYKDKCGSSDNVPLGLYIYPILQTADILVYKATEVPVGEDQVQHIQLSQHLARIFNNRYGEIFPVPNPLIDESCARIKSLRQPDKKMSKSDSNAKSRVDITDHPDTVRQRIREAVTDMTSEVTYEPDGRPGVSNLVLLQSLCTGKSCSQVVEDSRGLDTGQFKLVVAEAVVERLKPIREEFLRLTAEPAYIRDVLKKGAEKATEIAARTVDEVKKAVGMTS